MNVLFPFHEGDYLRSLAWMKWTRDLGQTGVHDLFLMPSKTIGDTDEVESIAREIFSSVSVVRDYEGLNGWPQGPNSCMRQAGWYFSTLARGPWMFLENDAILLIPSALSDLESEYKNCGKPFMAAIVPAFKDATGGLVPEHCTGNAIYPQETPSEAPRLLVASDVAFDVYGAKEMLPKAHRTALIQHVFNISGSPPTFPNQESLRLLQPGAVLFHRCKDMSLIARLRERAQSCGASSDLGSRNGAQGDPATGFIIPSETPGANSKVYTYYALVNGMEEDQQWLLQKWKESWRANGWDPVVLGPMDANATPEELSIIDSFPSINPRDYERACWMRWVAMRDCGGLMVDYDVMNYGFTPEHVPPYNNRIRLFDGYVPCVVRGKQEDYANILAEFLSIKVRGVKHWSDMLAMEALQDKYDTGKECVEYGKPGWKAAKLVHYAHGVCGGKPRSEVIPGAEMERRKGTLTRKMAEDFIKLTTRDHINALAKLSKKDGFAKGRIIKQLRTAGLFPSGK